MFLVGVEPVAGDRDRGEPFFKNFEYVFVFELQPLLFCWRSLRLSRDEESFDAVGISDTYLDVIFFAEAGIGVKKVAFPEDGFDGVKRRFTTKLSTHMEILYNCAVKVTKEQIVGPTIF